MTTRRHFLGVTGAAVGVAMLPRTAQGAITPIPNDDRKALADVALESARSRGASYADVRIGRYLNQSFA